MDILYTSSSGKKKQIKIIFRSPAVYILCYLYRILHYQIMLILVWNDVSLSEVFETEVLYKLSSIFITAAFLRFFQSMYCFLCFCKLYGKMYFSLLVLSECKVFTLHNFLLPGYRYIGHYPELPWIS